MMDAFPIPAESDAVIQTAFVVPDIQASMAWWTHILGAGPWFVFDRVGKGGTLYRGAAGEAEFTIAMGYSGKMMYELIQPLDEKPSIFREWINKAGYGIHHFARMTQNIEQSAHDHEVEGRAVIFRGTASDSKVYFIDGGTDGTGYLELVEDSPGTRALFEAIWRASIGWDGSRPVRSILELLA